MTSQDEDNNPYLDWFKLSPEKFIAYMVSEIRQESQVIYILSESLVHGETPIGVSPEIHSLKAPEFISISALKIELIIDIAYQYLSERESERRKSKDNPA